MTIKYAPIMTWMRYLEMNIWSIKVSNPKYYNSEEEIIKKFNDLYKNELVREGNSDLDINPYKGVGEITIHSVGTTFTANDYYGYLACYWRGIYGNIGKKKLGFAMCLRGFDKEYFKFIENEDDDYIFVESVVNGKNIHYPNVRRLINALFMRPQPYFECFDQREFAFWEYSPSERKEMIKECKKY